MAIHNGFTKDSIPHSPARNALFNRCGLSSRFFHELLYKIPLPTSVGQDFPEPYSDVLGPIALLIWRIPPLPNRLSLHEGERVTLPQDRQVVLRVQFDGTILKWLLLSADGQQSRNNWDTSDRDLQAIAGIAGTTLKNLIVGACEGQQPRLPDWISSDQYDSRDFYDYF